MAEAKKSDQGRHGSYEFNPDYKKAIDYVQSPFRYPGGKFYALKYIVPFLNAYPHDEYREPFVGGGSVFFGKPQVEHNWINDLETLMIPSPSSNDNKCCMYSLNFLETSNIVLPFLSFVHVKGVKLSSMFSIRPNSIILLMPK